MNRLCKLVQDEKDHPLIAKLIEVVARKERRLEDQDTHTNSK